MPFMSQSILAVPISPVPRPPAQFPAGIIIFCFFETWQISHGGERSKGVQIHHDQAKKEGKRPTPGIYYSSLKSMQIFKTADIKNGQTYLSLVYTKPVNSAFRAF